MVVKGWQTGSTIFGAKGWEWVGARVEMGQCEGGSETNWGYKFWIVRVGVRRCYKWMGGNRWGSKGENINRRKY